MGAIFFCSLSTCLAWHCQVPFLLLFIILVKKNAPAQVFSQGVLSCSTHPSQRTSPKQLPAHLPSKCPLPASAAPPKQLLLQRVCPQPQHVHSSHSKASEPLTVGASPTFQQTHSNHMQTSQPAGLRENPAKQHACSNHSPTTENGHTQPTQGIHLEQLALVTRGLCHRAPRDNVYIRLLFKDWEIYLICLIHRNKHKELSKMRRQKHYLPNTRNKTKFQKNANKNFTR